MLYWLLTKKLPCRRILADFRRPFAKIQAKIITPATRRGGPERLSREENYFSPILLGLFSPVNKTMCGLCFVSHPKRVQVAR